MQTQTTSKYIAPVSNATDPWEIVHGALIDQGITNPRPAPAASLTFRPRHPRHDAGSDAAQQDLQALAGWSRRGVLAGLLAGAAAPAAAALPTTTVETIPETACPGVPPASVSPRMAAVVAEAVRLTAVSEALAAEPDTPAADAAAEAIGNLVNENPVTIADLAAKLSAIAQTLHDDCGNYVLQRLATDATMLVGGAR